MKQLFKHSNGYKEYQFDIFKLIEDSHHQTTEKRMHNRKSDWEDCSAQF